MKTGSPFGVAVGTAVGVGGAGEGSGSADSSALNSVAVGLALVIAGIAVAVEVSTFAKDSDVLVAGSMVLMTGIHETIGIGRSIRNKIMQRIDLC
jgi:hypothetical protein